MFDLKAEETYFPEVVFLRESIKKGIEFNSFTEFHHAYEEMKKSTGFVDFIVAGNKEEQEKANKVMINNFMNNYAIFKVSTAK